MAGEQVRGQARRVGELAAQVRAVAAKVVSSAISAVEWRGAAARAFRERTDQEAHRLLGVAATVDDAGAELMVHARVLDAVDRAVHLPEVPRG